MSREVTLQLKGMSCHHCAMAIQESLSDVEGVIKADVNFEENKATVNIKDDVKNNSLLEAVQDAGYSASVV